MIEREMELGTRVLRAMLEEYKRPAHAFTRRSRQAQQVAAHHRGEAHMRALTAGLGSLEPPMPVEAAPPSAGFTFDRMRVPVAAIGSATPKRRRVRKATAAKPAQASELGPVA